MLMNSRLDQSAAPSLRKRLALGPDQRLLVTVGNAKRGQALDKAMIALSKLPPTTHWAFVGAGYEGLQSLAADLGVSNRVHFVGRLPPDEIVPAITDADLAVILYFGYSENYAGALPNGLFQAVSAGLPQIVPPLPEIAKLAAQFGFGLIADPQKPEAIVDAVLRLQRDSEMRTRLQENATRAAAALSWKAEEQQFLQVLETALAARSQLRPSIGRIAES